MHHGITGKKLFSRSLLFALSVSLQYNGCVTVHALLGIIFGMIAAPAALSFVLQYD